MENKAISPVRPSEPKRAVGWVLDVWASGVHHQAGLGSADPEWRSVFTEPPPVPALGPTVPVCDRSDELYDGTPQKYERRARSDVRVLYCSDMVERAKSGMPPVVTAYLLFKYPRAGRYAPQLRGLSWSDEPSRAFVERGCSLGVEGFQGSERDMARFAKWLRRQERKVKSLLAGEVESHEKKPFRGAFTLRGAYNRLETVRDDRPGAAS